MQIVRKEEEEFYKQMTLREEAKNEYLRKK